MKQIVCEMCGGTDILKQDGLFMCQSCGMKYSLEEAKKMMIEGTVEVQGTVRVDNSAFVEKYLANARRAKEKEDWEETEKYYNMVEQNDPNNIEAIFYSAYGKAKASLVSDDIYKRQAVFKVLTNCISIIDDKYDIERAEENKAAIQSMAQDLAKMMLSEFVFTEVRDGYGIVIRTNKHETYTLFATLIDKFTESINNIAKIEDHVYLHESLILVYRYALQAGFHENVKRIIRDYISREETCLKNIRQKAIDAYWAEHADEKRALDNEKSSLENQIEELNKQINELPESKQLEREIEEIKNLQQEKNSIGLLKFKERKAAQEKIDAAIEKAEATEDKRDEIAKPMVDKIDEHVARINEINAELTKDR